MQLLGTGHQRAGKTARVAYGNASAAAATPLAYSKFQANETGDDLPTENFTSYLSSFAGRTTGITPGEGLVGIQNVDWNFGGNWDAGLNPFDTPPGFYPRDDFRYLYMFESVIDVVFWFFPYARFRTVNNGAEVKGLVTWECSGKNQGTWTPPTGSN